MMDSPIPAEPELELLNETSLMFRKVSKPGAHFTLYSEHRRERRQSGIVKKNYYELLAPSESRLSPMGKLAQSLMRQVLNKKGKQEKDIVP